MAIALAAINARLIVPLHLLGHNRPEANVSISSAFRATRCRLHVLDIVENVLDIVQTQGHVYFDPKRTSLTWFVRLMLIKDKI